MLKNTLLAAVLAAVVAVPAANAGTVVFRLRGDVLTAPASSGTDGQAAPGPVTNNLFVAVWNDEFAFGERYLWGDPTNSPGPMAPTSHLGSRGWFVSKNLFPAFRSRYFAAPDPELAFEKRFGFSSTDNAIDSEITWQELKNFSDHLPIS